MALQLKMDPTNLEAGARRAEAALAGVKGEAIQAESAIDAMAREGAQDFARLTTRAQEFGREAGQVKTASTGMGFAVQNAAFQIGDMATQIAGGTSAARALAQQLPQLLGGFGIMGAVIGGAVAVLGALVPLIWQSADAAESATDAIDLYGDAFDQIKADLAAAKALEEQYTEALTTGSAQRIEAIEREAAIRQKMLEIDLLDLADQQEAAAKALADAQGPLNDALAEEARLREELAIARASKDADLAAAVLAEELATATAELERQQRAFDKQSLQYDLIQAQIDTNNEKLTATTAILGEIASGAGESAIATTSIADAANDATAAFQGLAGWAQMANANISAAAQSAAALRANAAADIAGMQPALSGPAGMGSSPPSGGAVLTSPRPGQRDVDSVAFGFSGGGGGGGSAAVDDYREAYDRLIASLDPVVKRQQEMAEAQETVNAAFAAGEISAQEQANALDMIRDKYAETTDAMTALRDTGATALDGLIGGTLSLSEALKQMAQDLMFATLKAELLNHVTGGTASMSLGGLIMQGLFSGFHDAGGTIGMGQVGMVGERGPELVRATPGGAIVTSRVDTARMMQQAVDVHVSVSVDDDGKIKAMATKAARAGASSAVETVKRNLAGWQSMLATDGALA